MISYVLWQGHDVDSGKEHRPNISQQSPLVTHLTPRLDHNSPPEITTTPAHIGTYALPRGAGRTAGCVRTVCRQVAYDVISIHVNSDRHRGDGSDRDRDDYQTVFAARDGAVAAPTAGLHFTPELLAALDARGVARVVVTLHVGAGTFLPVTAEDPRDHRMHAEWGEITPGAAAAVNAAKAKGGRVVALGSTALRLLETAADDKGDLHPFTGKTDIFILPGYRFRIADLMLTNFHLPRSTLFMLVCAFAGTARMKRAYAHAMEAGYRFYSYGDACLLAPEMRP
ncbi:MAG: S-adenosylmethionine:tRNA ribosyltransferase-isomerase [Proteobacteria bacterium]|nr:S-adenosylmethionine:tRNA ribosyltransferase-isomerase [Pseudomonadota bacterium]